VSVGYFRPHELRHTCATLLTYEGCTVREVAEHLGHGDPGFTARTWMRARRGVPIEQTHEQVPEAPGGRRRHKTTANRPKPTPGLEPGTPSLRALITCRRESFVVVPSRINPRDHRNGAGDRRPPTATA
jgi:hypothetical protein